MNNFNTSSAQDFSKFVVLLPDITKRSGTSLGATPCIEKDLQGTGTSGFGFVVHFLHLQSMTIGSHQYLARKENTQLKEKICVFQKSKKLPHMYTTFD